MIVPLAIATLLVAVADDGAEEVSFEEQFRLLYAMGDKIGAYRLLFAAHVGDPLIGDESQRITDVRIDVLRPLLLQLTEPLAQQTTLEGIKAVLEEVEAALDGWWYQCQGRGVVDLNDIAHRLGIKPKAALDYQKLRWPDDRVTQHWPAEIPALANLLEIFDEGEQEWITIFRDMRKIITWDKERVLVQRTEWHGDLPIEHFEIWSIERLIASDAKIPDIGADQ